MKERIILDKLVSVLRKNGFPEKSFAIEYVVGGCRVDFAIVEPKTKKELALFEFKSDNSKNIMESAKERLKRYAKELNNDKIALYLVVPSNASSDIEVYSVDYGNNSINLFGDISNLKYDYLKAGIFQSNINDYEKGKKEITKKIACICYSLAVVLFLIFFLKQLSIISIDTNDLLIISGFIVLVLFPYLDRIKFLGIEIEKYKE